MNLKKLCPKCNQLKSADLFYKKTSSPDGLQPYCKCCQNSYNKQNQQLNKEKFSTQNFTKNGVPRGLHAKRLSNYHIHHGLEYKINGKLKKHQYRNIITYKCLSCGKEVTADLDTAWSYRYNCNSCAHNIPGLPTDLRKRPSNYQPIFVNDYNTKEGMTKIQQEVECLNKGITKDIILNKIKEIRNKTNTVSDSMENIQVFVINVPHPKPKKSLWSRFKSLFS